MATYRYKQANGAARGARRFLRFFSPFEHRLSGSSGRSLTPHGPGPGFPTVRGLDQPLSELKAPGRLATLARLEGVLTPIRDQLTMAEVEP
jgi:hypothetical protein